MIVIKAFIKADRSKLGSPPRKWVRGMSAPKLPTWLEISEDVVNGVGHGVFMFYFDDYGQYYADDYYLTLENAIYNAYWSCQVEPEDWEVVEKEI